MLQEFFMFFFKLRGKKKLKKHRPGIDERIPEPSEMKHSILSDPYFFSGKARPRRTLPPRYTDIILRKDCKYGMKGEIFKVKTPHAYTIIGKKVAAKKTPLTLKKYSSHITPELEQEMTQKRLERNLRFIIEHAAVQFKRKIAGPKREYYWPITRKDIVNRVWNVYKIPLKEEQIIMKQNYPDRPISKPGYQLIYVKLDDGKPPAMLRVYLKRGGNTYQGF